MGNSNRNTPASASWQKSFAVTARESLESIVVAFALAFIFRAFIVEAFVIPTGSMAPTLYGQQITHTCSTCGFEYAHGIEQMLPNQRPLDRKLRCPNCGSKVDQIAGPELAHPSSGDRILVHKWPFSVGGGLAAKRWNVTVFKDPHNGTVNYIKRLVGKPGEFLEIIHGDIYAAPIKEVVARDAGVIADMDRLRTDLYRYRQGEIDLTREQVEPRFRSINERILPFLRIQRKAVDAPDAQQSLWFNVYNHDYLPNYDYTKGQPEARVGWSALLLSVDSDRPEDLDAGRVPPDLRHRLEQLEIRLPERPGIVTEEAGRKWRVAGGAIGDLLVVRQENRLAVYEAAAAEAWNTQNRQITFKSESEAPLSIRFTGKPIEDFYAYNLQNPDSPSRLGVPVGDLRLAFTWFPDAGNGGLVLDMNRHRDRFTARIGVDGTVQIDHLAPGARKAVPIGARKLDGFRAGKAVLVEFVNVDFRVALSIDGQEVVASNDSQYTPNIRELLSRDGEDPNQTVRSEVKIGAWRMQCRLEHVELDRDVYYRSSLILEPASSPQPEETGAQFKMVQNPFFRWPGWGTQGWPIMLRDDGMKEYFMLGDNSPGSKDSRLWWLPGPHLQHLGERYQVGTVPDDQLIGQAFFVYWPSGYRRSWTADIGIIPNFGRMRWIR